jgi:hypothetical protein
LADSSWLEWFHVGGSLGGTDSGSGSGDSWDLRPIYRRLCAAYGWTYLEIDQHTLLEVNELFEGWGDAPPTNLLLKAIIEGFGGKGQGRAEPPVSAVQTPQDVDSALQELASKAGPALPVMRGKDPALGRFKPVFDEDSLKAKNLSAQQRMKARGNG